MLVLTVTTICTILKEVFQQMQLTQINLRRSVHIEIKTTHIIKEKSRRTIFKIIKMYRNSVRGLIKSCLGAKLRPLEIIWNFNWRLKQTINKSIFSLMRDRMSTFHLLNSRMSKNHNRFLRKNQLSLSKLKLLNMKATKIRV